METTKNFETPEEAKLHFLDYWRIIRVRKAVVHNRALFERFKVGEKVEFEFVRDAKSDVIIGIK